MELVKKKCPRCGAPDFEHICEEIDIGVGVQTHILFGECRACGQVGHCHGCGAWENKEGKVIHEDWCLQHERED